MRYYYSFILLFTTFFGHSQIEICSPNNASSCESARHICQDYYTEYCTCPAFEFSPTLSVFFVTDLYSFDVTAPNQTVNIDVDGFWNSYQVLLIGPFTFESSCDSLIPATNDQNLFVGINQQNTPIGLVNLPNVVGRYYVFFVGTGFSGGDICHYLDIDFSPELECISEPCETCIGSFAPIPSSPGTNSAKYLVGAWAKEAGASPNKTSYNFPELTVTCEVSGVGSVVQGPFSPQGVIIDGWQRIEEEIIIPAGATNIEVKLSSTNGDVYFDDIRFFPFDASMKSYVYDPVNMRLSAELDERHYATFYEYDEEGKLVRIKKETEKGVMTIQETKSNSSK